MALIYDSFSRRLVVAPLPGICLVFEWPRVGACRNCSHGHEQHTARRDHGFIQWKCKVQGCPCQKYSPAGKGA